MELQYNAEIGRELGWDLARYGWIPRDDANDDVIDGHKAGVAHFVRAQRVPDRFERKWLQLRQNALRRGRVVQPEVTPAFIRLIDHPICPVTLVPMTHALRADTDWSIDRVNNDGAYAEGNLVVISTLANKAKADRSFEGVVQTASELGDHETVEGLNSRQWGRLASIMVGACASPADELAMSFPLLTRVPKGSVAPEFQILQSLVYRVTHKASIRSQFVKRFNRVQPDKSKALLLQVAADRLSSLVKSVDYLFDASLDAGFMSLLLKWHRAIPDAKRDDYLRLLRRIDNAEELGIGMQSKWSLDTKGYFADAHTKE
jgi:hypothetical protein